MKKLIPSLALITVLVAPMAQAQGFIWDVTLNFPSENSDVTKSSKGTHRPILPAKSK